MIDLSFFGGLPVAVLGLGRSGTTAARALTASGAEVWAWDDSETVREAAAAKGIPIVDLMDCDWRELTSLVISPGIPHRHPSPHPMAALARENGCEIIGDIELLGRAQRDAQYIGITGTNGKSTTTALIGHIFELSGRQVAVGGNLGTPALALDGLDSSGFYVLEMSSYQLEITVSITFDVAVLLNISPDHLERHGGLEGYKAAKELIFHRQTKPRTAVVAVDDAHTRALFEDLAATGLQFVVPVSGQTRLDKGVYVENGILTDATGDEPVAVMDLKPIVSLPGRHNWQNAAAAYAACTAAGIDPPVVSACLRSFPGLAHRQELVAVLDGVAYINDSKATNPDAAARALDCYREVFWIAGGRPKADGLAGLDTLLGKAEEAFLIGEAAGSFATELGDRLRHSQHQTLEQAVAAASRAARAALAEGRCRTPVVLLSPACASFDQFADFEARGDAFKQAVGALGGAESDLEDWSQEGAWLQ